MKKFLGYTMVAILAITVFVTSKTTGQSGNVQIADLTVLNTANAECAPITSPLQQGGRCFGIPQWGTCMWDPNATECFSGY